MKKIIVVFTVLCVFQLKGQEKSLMSRDTAVWFGLDFTRARLMGNFAENSELGQGSEKRVITVEMPRWNDLFFREYTKYDVTRAIKRELFIFDLAPVTKLNAAILPDSIYTKAKEYKIPTPEKTFNEMLANYSSDKYKSGLGYSFIVEYFNDQKEEASIYVVFFDIAAKKIIAYKNLKGIAKGIGVRNHWGGALKNIIEQLKNYGYPGILWQLKKQETK